MGYYIVFDAKGEALQAGYCIDGHECDQRGDGFLTVVTDAPVHFQSTYYDEGLKEFPRKPSDSHVWNWSSKEWVADDALAASQIRAERDGKLAASDWTQLPDVPLDTKTEWATYRQALRDVTDQPGFPFDIIWPTPPA